MDRAKIGGLMKNSFFALLAIVILLSMVSCSSTGIETTIGSKLRSETPNANPSNILSSTSIPASISLAAPTITAPITPTVSPSPYLAVDCPKIVNDLSYEGNILLKSTDQQPLIKITIKGKLISTNFLDLGAINNSPYLSPDGEWLYWIEAPTVVIEKGQISSLPGEKILHIVNLQTNKKQAIQLPKTWLIAMGSEWTQDGKIKIVIDEHQDEKSGQIDRRSYAFITPNTGQVVGFQQDKYQFDKIFYSLQPMEGFAQYNPITSGAIYTAFGEGPYVRYIDKEHNEVWSSPVYNDIFPNLENVWDRSSKSAAYITTTDFNDELEELYTVNFLDIENLKLTELKMPSIEAGDMVTSAIIKWSPFSDYLYVSFLNKGYDAQDTIYRSGTGFLINPVKAEIKPLCVANQQFYKGLFINYREPFMLFSTIGDQNESKIWILDIQRWEVMNVFSYTFKNIRVDLIGAEPY